MKNHLVPKEEMSKFLTRIDDRQGFSFSGGVIPFCRAHLVAEVVNRIPPFVLVGLPQDCA